MLPEPCAEPSQAVSRPRTKRFNYDSEVRWLNHRSFRFPAKFHPAVAKALVERFTKPGDLILDSFCGSGTLLLEAMVAGRNALGFDLDPLSVFVSSAKVRQYDLSLLISHTEALEKWLKTARLDDQERGRSFQTEISLRQYKRRLAAFRELEPPIPNLFHWFRRRVVLQLLEIKRAVNEVSVNQDSHDFFLLCFASIIRNSSNADPVPVSGLEVTAHMRRLEEDGRAIDPYTLMLRSLRRNLAAVRTFLELTNGGTKARVFLRDASKVWLENVPRADVAITSPPYLNAVDYYRRHQLEMYWLDLVSSHEDRLKLLPSYIGRGSPSRAALGNEVRAVTSRVERIWTQRLTREAPDRVRALQHYASSMQTALANQARALKKEGLLIVVVGDSRLAGRSFPTSLLLEELCLDSFKLVERYSYPVTNRYMSYARRNGADIAKDSVLVLQRR